MRALIPPDCSLARAELRAALTSAGWPPDVIDDAELAFQELYINAWQHGGCQAPPVLVCLRPAVLRVSVCDDCPDLPSPRVSADPYAVSGRGLHLVRALTDRVGADSTKSGKVVWFELDFAA
ncbi:Anti-sigma regulatory factor (Ser/Thr protein kinase) [Streptomyces sp. TLI_053]|uniref:ATP-binding protein n=1 Tax=Streptomyces sp. TLI_053 TaxID=1855352 RepID=UPI00087BD0E0|nr:ATP-binding protein [Streptomyces sp. TLI_053]SDT72889.1 Anti-sigma regulatory factor (Ser/Thr protein kinase) [Streptomyces sp. TLI_053]